MPVLGQYLLLPPHDVQEDWPVLAWYLPVAHDEQDVLAVLPWYLPAAQEVHDVWPSVPWYLPAAQAFLTPDEQQYPTCVEAGVGSKAVEARGRGSVRGAAQLCTWFLPRTAFARFL